MEKTGKRVLVAAAGVGMAYALFGAFFITLALNVRTPTGERGLDVWWIEPRGPDSHDYENIAFSLARGQGFIANWSAPEARRPYEEAYERGYTYWRRVVERRGKYPETYRPPAYPAFLGLIYATFGRRFPLTRLANCLLLGLIGASVFLIGTRLSKRPLFGGLACAAFLATNTRMWSAATWVATETMAAATIALAMLALLVALERGHLWRYAFAGLALAVAVLTRTSLVLAVPFFCVPLLFDKARPARLRWKQAGVYLGVCAVPLIAWSIRCSIIEQQPVALGTLGGKNLPAGYTRTCLEHHGQWRPGYDQPYAEEMQEAWQAQRAGERGAVAARSREVFFRLVRENWRLIPRLSLAKFTTTLPVPFGPEEFRDIRYELPDALLFYSAMIGIFLIGSKRLRWIGLAPVLGTFLSAVLVFASLRFRIPMFPGLAVLAGAAICRAAGRLDVCSETDGGPPTEGGNV